MSDYSIICAIEAGRLETQTILMLNTLKRFGGALSSARVIAFQGRQGPRISAATEQVLKDLGVEYVVSTQDNRAPWFNYTNKIAAVEYAQKTFTTPWRMWLDSDIVFLSEPSFVKMLKPYDCDFLARFEYTAPAEHAGETVHAEYWRQIARICSVDLAATPYEQLDLPATSMKPYFNSGFMVWNANTDFAETYAKNFYRILAARVTPKTTGPWFADQVALTPTIAALRLRHRMMTSEDHLMLFAYHLADRAFLDRLPSASAVHYSKSRDPASRQDFDALVVAQVPQMQEIFDAAERIPTNSLPSMPERARTVWRRARQKLYVKTCRPV